LALCLVNACSVLALVCTSIGIVPGVQNTFACLANKYCIMTVSRQFDYTFQCWTVLIISKTVRLSLTQYVMCDGQMNECVSSSGEVCDSTLGRTKFEPWLRRILVWLRHYLVFTSTTGNISGEYHKLSLLYREYPVFPGVKMAAAWCWQPTSFYCRFANGYTRIYTPGFSLCLHRRVIGWFYL